MTAVARPATTKLLAGPLATLVIAGNAVGAACVLANWWRLADTSDLTANLSSAGLAIVGVLVAGLTNALWLLAARGAIARRRHRLSTRVGTWAAPLTTPAPLRVAAPVATANARTEASLAGLIAVDGATLYHRPGCPLVTGKRTAEAAVETHEANGLRPCGVCEPGMTSGQDGARR
jgi:hypothetical protein